MKLFYCKTQKNDPYVWTWIENIIKIITKDKEYNLWRLWLWYVVEEQSSMKNFSWGVHQQAPTPLNASYSFLENARTPNYTKASKGFV